MGSFSVTCFASNQTIAENDLCRVVPILQASTFDTVKYTYREAAGEQCGIANSSCYADSHWRPQTGYLPAEYDDYGQVKLKLDPVSRAHLLNFFADVATGAPVVAQGENSSHDHPFNFPDILAKEAPQIQALLAGKQWFTSLKPVEDDHLDGEINACWDAMWEVAFKHRLFMRNHVGHIRPLQFAIMHERVYEALVARGLAGQDWEGLSYAPVPFLTRTLERARERIKEMDEAHPEKEENRRRGMAYMIMSDVTREAVRFLDGGSGNLSRVHSDVVSKAAADLVDGKINDEAFIAAITPVMHDQYATGELNALNLRFLPMVTSGQDYDNEIGRNYASLIADVSKRITRDRKVRCFGEYSPYVMTVAAYADIEKVQKLLRECDSDMDDIEIAAAGVAQGTGLTIRFTCPLDLEDLRETVGKLPDSVDMVVSILPYAEAVSSMT